MEHFAKIGQKAQIGKIREHIELSLAKKVYLKVTTWTTLNSIHGIGLKS
tara:strand:+ start:3024 stop:3170 length:147 start_codon:yes stop_codon:yes gene_type:complete